MTWNTDELFWNPASLFPETVQWPLLTVPCHDACIDSWTQLDWSTTSPFLFRNSSTRLFQRLSLPPHQSLGFFFNFQTSDEWPAVYTVNRRLPVFNVQRSDGRRGRCGHSRLRRRSCRHLLRTRHHRRLHPTYLSVSQPVSRSSSLLADKR